MIYLFLGLAIFVRLAAITLGVDRLDRPRRQE